MHSLGDRPILGFKRILQKINVYENIHYVEIPTVRQSLRMHCIYKNLDNIYFSLKLVVSLIIFVVCISVSGLSVLPSMNQLNLTNDYEFWVVAEGIGDVMFAVKILTGIYPSCLLWK